MEPQSAQRKTLCSQDNFLSKIKLMSRSSPVPQKLIRLDLKALESIQEIYGAQLVTYLRLIDKNGGELINCNAEKVKAGKNDQSVKRTQR
jgi:hypothetical protein